MLNLSGLEKEKPKKVFTTSYKVIFNYFNHHLQGTGEKLPLKITKYLSKKYPLYLNFAAYITKVLPFLLPITNSTCLNLHLKLNFSNVKYQLY